MERVMKYLYRIELQTSRDVVDFNRAATGFSGRIYLVNGNKRLNAKSILGVQLAKLTWDEIYIESDENCYFDFRKFIVK
ncbi:MAG: HPr family phosphocarrier protein [Clostridia bacterium]|nr:HPr family phosphocarrier protein [Clostridia bacterium]